VQRLADAAYRRGCLPVPPAASSFLLLLDDQPLLTPGKRPLAVPTLALAEAIAAEWAAQGAVLSPASMSLTRLANTAIDGACGKEAAVRADIVKYAACDLLYYRAQRPQRGTAWLPGPARRSGSPFALAPA
jgi:chaperone required for assembly of F1-ATPase